MKGERGQAEDNIGFATSSFVDVHLEKILLYVASLCHFFLKCGISLDLNPLCFEKLQRNSRASSTLLSGTSKIDVQKILQSNCTRKQLKSREIQLFFPLCMKNQHWKMWLLLLCLTFDPLNVTLQNVHILLHANVINTGYRLLWEITLSCFFNA